ncbi:N-methyl-L-tryptophan oxidase [soil metagenome]
MHDVLVVGLGAMGSATLHALASRGVDVVGVDAYDPPHSLGSTHGRSRIIREAYFEHPAYVPLVRSAYAAWAQLEAASGAHLFLRTGGLNIGARDSALVAGAIASAERHGLVVEVLTAREINRRHPAFSVPADMVGVFEASAGMLFPEACITAFLQVARSLGADVRPNTRVSALDRSADGIRAMTDAGELRARRVVVCAGPWTAPLLATLGIALPLVVTRQTMHWLAVPSDASVVRPDKFPVALIEHDGGRIFYTMPDVGDGVKAAIHHEGRAVDAAAVDRAVHASDTEVVEALVARFLPGAGARIRESAVCLYTNTPDHHFIIDTGEGMPDVVVVSACSGHGFKFASAIGDIAARMALGESATTDLSHFTAVRFELPAHPDTRSAPE